MDDHDRIVALEARLESMEDNFRAYLPVTEPRKLKLGASSKASIGVSIAIGLYNAIRALLESLFLE